MKKTHLQIQDLRTVYENLRFSVGPINLTSYGGLIGVLGKNGSGKSTLLRTLAGIEDHAKSFGIIKICGQNIDMIPSRERALLCSWSNSRGDYEDDWTVRDIILFGRYPHHLGHPTSTDLLKTQSVMEYLQIESFADRFMGELSSGFQQKVWLAKALSVEAPLLVLDEPTTHLDAGASWEFMDIIKRISSDSFHPTQLILCVMHDLPLASSFCDRILGLKDGRMVYDETKGNFSQNTLRKTIFDLPPTTEPYATNH